MTIGARPKLTGAAGNLGQKLCRHLNSKFRADMVDLKGVTEGIDFAVLYLTSLNEGSPWDLTATQAVLGYRPRDGLVTLPPPLWRRVLGRVRRLLGMRAKTSVRH